MSKMIYKIQNRNSGEFATANGWSKNGKQWNHLGHVKLHLNGNFEFKSRNGKYQNADLVTYEIVEVSREPMHELMIKTYEEKKKKEYLRNISEKKWKLENAKRKLEEAQRELELLGA
jgi:hypothetical protein